MLSASDAPAPGVQALLKRQLQAQQGPVQALQARVAELGLRCGTWHRIGPFRDDWYGAKIDERLLVKNPVPDSGFDFVFEVEKDLLKDGVPDPEAVYEAGDMPGDPGAKRRWVTHPEWLDGYYYELPRGPAPSRNETQYLYRVIHAEKAGEIHMNFYSQATSCLSSHTGAYTKGWINGQPIRWPGWRAVGARVVSIPVNLTQGENHLVIKFTNRIQQYGFAFGIEGIDPPLPAEKRLPENTLSGSWVEARPWVGESEGPVGQGLASFLTIGKDWFETALASPEGLRAYAEQGSFRPATFRVRAGDPLQKVEIGLRGCDELWVSAERAHAQGGWIWTVIGEAILVDDQGNRTPLATLKPFHQQLNRHLEIQADNEPGQGPRIGGGVFSHHIAMHTDGRIAFRLDKPYVKLEAVLGLDDKTRKGAEVDVGFRGRFGDAPGQELWNTLAGLFGGDADRAEMEFEKRAGLWQGYLDSADPADLVEAYRKAIAAELSLEAEAAAKELPSPPEGAFPDPRAWHEMYQQVARYNRALEVIRTFRWEPAPEPYYEAAERSADGILRSSYEAAMNLQAPSEAGAAYTETLAALGREVSALLEEIRDSGEPRMDQVFDLAGRIDRVFADEIRKIGPIAYVEDMKRICVIHPADPAGSRKVLFETPRDNIVYLNPTWDGKTLLFSVGKDLREGGYSGAENSQMYEINLDGTGLVEIPNGEGWGAEELPDGALMFVRQVDKGIAVCQSHDRFMLCRMNRDGSGFQVLSANMEDDHAPRLMADGRVLFTRWDYGVEKNVGMRHALWTMNPDGTGLDLYFGNTIVDPIGFWSARPIPGRPEVVSIFGGHHHREFGVVGLVSNQQGQESQRGLGYRYVSRDLIRYDDEYRWYMYRNPWPLNEQQYLVSFGGNNRGRRGIQLLDRAGNQRPVFAPRDHGCDWPVILQARTKPPLIPYQSDRVDWEPWDISERSRGPIDWSKKATMILSDVYLGISPPVKRGQAKYLAVMEQLPVYEKARFYNWGGPLVDSTVSRTTSHVKRFVGLVPIEVDGSAHFEVPALSSLYFHVLDKDGKTLMTMGSDLHAMPGETRSCTGCHEIRHGITAPPPRANMPLAAQKPAVRPVQPNWGTHGLVDFQQVVQPVLDRHCVRCHGGPKPEGRLDLSGDRTRGFSQSYDQILEKELIDFTPRFRQADHDNEAPLTRYSMVSRLNRYLDDPDHSGSEVPFEDKLRVNIWINSNAPYYGANLTLRADRSRNVWTALQQEEAELKALYKKRCTSCHTADFQEQQLARKPKRWVMDTWSHENLTHPGWSAMLQAPLAEAAGGWGLCGKENPVFEDKQDPVYVRMLELLGKAKAELERDPRLDMRPLQEWLVDPPPPTGP